MEPSGRLNAYFSASTAFLAVSGMFALLILVVCTFLKCLSPLSFVIFAFLFYCPALNLSALAWSVMDG